MDLLDGLTFLLIKYEINNSFFGYISGFQPGGQWVVRIRQKLVRELNKKIDKITLLLNKYHG